jgi:hypothetical protein
VHLTARCKAWCMGRCDSDIGDQPASNWRDPV